MSVPGRSLNYRLSDGNDQFCGFPDLGQVVRNGKSSPEIGLTGVAYITSC